MNKLKKYNKTFKFLMILGMFLNMLMPAGGMTVEAIDDGSYAEVTWGDIKLEHTDKEGINLEGDFKIDSHVKMTFHYSVEDLKDVKINKTYNFQIPEEIKIIKQLNIEIRDIREDENIDRHLGNATVNTDGTMSVQFLDEINNKSFNENRSGWIKIKSQFDKLKLGDGGDKTITFEFLGKSKDIEIKFDEVQKDVTLNKEGSYNKDENEIEWEITINPTTTPEGLKIKDFTITDKILDGQTYVEGSASLNGNKIIDELFKESTLTYKFEELTHGKEEKLTFKTVPDIKELDDGSVISLDFSNTVEGSYVKNNETISKEASKTVTIVSELIGKTGKYDKDGKKINWEIEINKSGVTLEEGVIIKDTLPEHLILPEETDVYVEVVKDEDNKRLDNSKYDFNSDADKNTFTVTFNHKFSETYLLKFSTKVDEVFYISNHTTDFKNKATIELPNSGPSQSVDSNDVGVTSSIISKSSARVGQEIIWTIKINSNKIKIENPVLIDKLSEDLEIDSYEIVDDTEPSKWEYESNNNKVTFTYVGEPKEINEEHIFKITTKIPGFSEKPEVYKKYFGSNSSIGILNNATLTGKGINQNTSATEKVASTVIKKSAKGYDYVKRIATWEIIINQNKMKINDAKVVDIIEKDHDYIVDSLKINSNTITEASQVKSHSINGKRIEINFHEIEDEIKITFETRIPNDVVDDFFKLNYEKKLENNSTLTGEQINGEVKSDATQTVKNTVVSKKGKYTPQSDFIDWEVIINSNILKLNGVKLEDKLQKGLILDPESVELIKLELQTDGSFKDLDSRMLIYEGDFTYDYQDTNKVVFEIGDIDTAYRLEFRTDIDDEYEKLTVENTITLKGSNGSQDGVAETIGVVFQAGAAGGTGTSTRGSLTIEKVDNHNKFMKLSGAKFELYKSDKTTLKATSDATDSNGNVVFDELPMGTYYIKEIAAPDKYTLDDELKEVTLTKGFDTKHITYTFENEREKTNITGTKEWVGGANRKPTIELQLLRNGKKIEEDDTFVSDGFVNPVKIENEDTSYTWTGNR